MKQELAKLGEIMEGWDSKFREKFSKQWARVLKKDLLSYAKQKTPSWFGAKFSKFTPLKIHYFERKKRLVIWGDPPNANVSGTHPYPFRKPIPAGVKVKRVFITSSRFVDGKREKDTSKGFWITPKTYQDYSEGELDPTFYTDKTSHKTVEIFGRHYQSSNGRKYPFAPVWYSNGKDAPDFDYCRDSVADELFKDPNIAQILQESFSKTATKLNKEVNI